MSWESRYLPPDPHTWQGRSDLPPDSCFYQLVQLVNLLEKKPEKANGLTFALLGFKCDEGIQRDLGRSGASEGPTAIKQQLAKLAIQRTEISCYDVGSIICTDHDLEASQHALGQVISLLLTQNIRPIVLGGGHEMAWGHYQGIARLYPPQKRLGIINFDAHFDMQSLHPSHKASATTTFFQIAEHIQANQGHFDYNCIGIQHAENTKASFDLANQFNTRIIFADELHQGLQEKCFDFVDRIADENDHIYMSLSLDVFSPAFAPGVSTIQPLGVYPWQIIPLLRQAAASTKMLSYEIAELLPFYDIDHRTAKLAAALVYEIIHYHKEPSRSR